mgnify:CR=1 FL=1
MIPTFLFLSKGVSVCEKCGAEVAVNSAFCSACGAPMPVVKPVSETAEEAEKLSDLKIIAVNSFFLVVNGGIEPGNVCHLFCFLNSRLTGL